MSPLRVGVLQPVLVCVDIGNIADTTARRDSCLSMQHIFEGIFQTSPSICKTTRLQKIQYKHSASLK